MIGVMDNEAHILITQNTSARLNVVLDTGGPVTRPGDPSRLPVPFQVTLIFPHLLKNSSWLGEAELNNLSSTL